MVGNFEWFKIDNRDLCALDANTRNGVIGIKGHQLEASKNSSPVTSRREEERSLDIQSLRGKKEKRRRR